MGVCHHLHGVRSSCGLGLVALSATDEKAQEQQYVTACRRVEPEH